MALLSLSISGCLLTGEDARDKQALAERTQATANRMAQVAPPGTNPYRGYVSRHYGDRANWLCHPMLAVGDNACRADTRATAVLPDGELERMDESFERSRSVDCFYVYPTVSTEMSANADFSVASETRDITRIQAALYQRVCDVYAPVYRQATLSLMALGMAPGMQDMMASVSRRSYDLAYADVVEAFMAFMAGRDGGGFILVGHSQGSELLVRLIKEVIEPSAYLSRHFVTAHVPGANIAVARGARDVDGDFAHTPPCRQNDQVHCVVGYSTFRRGDESLAKNPKYGVTESPDTQAMCVNPARLSGGPASLKARLPMAYPPLFDMVLKPSAANAGPFQQSDRNQAIDTPFYTLPRQIRGECAENDHGVHYLEVALENPGGETVIDELPGAFFGGAGWGLHLIDINVVQADLVHLAARQAAAWTGQFASDERGNAAPPE